MATDQTYSSRSYDAGEDLRTHQFKAMKLNAAGALIRCTASTDLVVGILMNKPNTGEAAEVAVEGMPKASMGAVVAACGTELMTDANGQLITATSGNKVFATNRDTVGGANEIAGIQMIGLYVKP